VEADERDGVAAAAVCRVFLPLFVARAAACVPGIGWWAAWCGMTGMQPIPRAGVRAIPLLVIILGSSCADPTIGVVGITDPDIPLFLRADDGIDDWYSKLVAWTWACSEGRSIDRTAARRDDLIVGRQCRTSQTLPHILLMTGDTEVGRWHLVICLAI